VPPSAILRQAKLAAATQEWTKEIDVLILADRSSQDAKVAALHLSEGYVLGARQN